MEFCPAWVGRKEVIRWHMKYTINSSNSSSKLSQLYHAWWVSMRHSLQSSQLNSLFAMLNFVIALQAMVIRIWSWRQNGVCTKCTKILFKMKSWCFTNFWSQNPSRVCISKRSVVMWKHNMDSPICYFLSSKNIFLNHFSQINFKGSSIENIYKHLQTIDSNVKSYKCHGKHTCF
jgi:hypothetical protein